MPADRLIFPERIRRLLKWRSERLAGAARWFPHAPLAGALALGGALLLRAGMQGAAPIWQGHFSALTTASLRLGARGVPFAMIGLGMLAMSIGLLLRSRFSWMVSLGLTALTIVVALKFTHAYHAALVYYDVFLLLALLASRRWFNRSSLAAGTLFALASGVLLLLYAVFGSFYLGTQFAPPIRDLTTAFYYAIVTMGTVGYGDITPHTAHARLFTVSIIILGITVFATSLSAIMGPVVGGSLRRIVEQRGKRMNRKDHFVVIGNTPLAYNTFRELTRRKQPVTLLFAQAPPEGEFEGADVVLGDPNSLEVLTKAGAKEARAVLALRGDDSENAFIVLAVKELRGRAKTVAAINDGKHLERMRLVQPDILLAPQVLGGEILAMALSGEAIDSNYVLDRLLHFGAETRATTVG